MKFSQERYDKAQSYSEKFLEAIYDRIPSVVNIVTLEGTKDNDGPMGARTVLTINDYLNNVDLVVVTDDDSNKINFQLKTSDRPDTVIFKLSECKYSNFKTIKGIHYHHMIPNTKTNVGYFIDFKKADVWSIYMSARDTTYFFKTDILRAMFRYEDAWSKGDIFIHEGDSLISFNIDTLCELYKAYSDFFMFGIRKEEKSKDVKYEEITNENVNAAM